MQLGFVTAILPDLSLADVARFAAQTGYDCIEVMCWPVSKAERRYAGVTHVDVTNFGPDEANKVQNTIAKHGVSISGLGYYPNALSSNMDEANDAVEHIRKVIVACETLRLRQMNT